MRRLVYISFTSLLFFNLSYSSRLTAEDASTSTKVRDNIAPATPSKPFVAFTGKITKNKVRLRLQPNLDGLVMKELNKDDLIVVLGENEDFYAVQPPQETKAYIFRTFVLDNVVEGNRVNVRLEPNTDAPVIAQLNQGERLQGIVSPINSKWLEIPTPQSARFYVAKEFVEKIGDPSMMATIAKRREEVNRLLAAAYTKSQEEMQKPFDAIQIDGIIGAYQKVITQYPEFNDQVSRAKELLGALQDAYLKKKVAFLETKNQQLNQQQKEAIAKAATAAAAAARIKNEQQQAQAYVQPALTTMPSYDSGQAFRQSNWEPIEQEIYKTWITQNGNIPINDYYQMQKDNAVILKGIIEPNNSSVKNKPGDFVLLNPNTQLPIAYLYATDVDLQTKIGQQVTVQASPRPNHHFAFPAFFVHGIN